MKHPFKGKGIVYYLLAWAVLILAHALVLKLQYHLPLHTVVFDSFLFNLMLSGFGFSLWWAIQYITPSYQGAFGTVVTFGALVILGASVITFLSDSILQQFFNQDSAYLAYNANAKPWKLLTGSIYLCVVILVYYLLRHSYKLSQKEHEEHELQGLLKQSELEMLKFQINPHFIFNSLNSISALTISEPAQAREMVIKLSDFLRGSLGQSKAEMHSLSSELEQMNLYLDIEKVRFGDRLTVNLEVDDTLLDKKVPNMILQPLYENAIKYGVYEQLETVCINTNIAMDQSYLVIKVINNYDSHAPTQKGKGIGLKNVRSRLELIYGIPDLVTIERCKDSFCVKLEIPQTENS